MATRRRTILTMLFCAGVTAGCGSHLAPVHVPGSDGATVPRGAVDALESRWPGIQLGSSQIAACPNTTGPSSPMATGDINGDGREDIVILATVAGTPRLVVLLARLDGEYSAVDLGDTAASSVAMLEVAPRGRVHRLASLAVDSYFGLDTVVLRDCSGAQTAYFWIGDSFEPQGLSN